VHRALTNMLEVPHPITAANEIVGYDRPLDGQCREDRRLDPPRPSRRKGTIRRASRRPCHCHGSRFRRLRHRN
jgi:hypothetical protein